MDMLRPSQSGVSADRDKSASSGSRSVLKQPTVTLTGELRYLTPLLVSEIDELQEKLHPPDSSQSKTIDEKISEKIRAALKLLAFRELHVLVQFWSPCVVGNYQLLTTLYQPFGLGVANEELRLYRSNSEQNTFPVDKDLEEEKEDISPPSRVFRRGLPEWTSDITNYLPKHFPQQECAIRCNLHGYLAIPVFDSMTSLCVGVLEFLMSSKNMSFSFEVQQVHKALKTQNLTSPQVFESGTPNVPNEHKQNELDKICYILKTMCDIHSLPLAQTWAVSPLNSFVSHDKIIEKSCGSFDTKCIGRVCMSTTDLPFHVGDLGMWPFREACKEQHLEKFYGVVGRALLTHGSSYCQDITDLSEEEYPLAHNARMSGLTSCYTIFLHSIEGDDDDYVLEFFLPLGMKDGSYISHLAETLKRNIDMDSGFELGEVSPIEVIGPPRDTSDPSLSLQPDTIQLSSITTANTLAFGMDSSDSESFLANVVKTDNKQGDNTNDTDKLACDDMSDNIKVVGSSNNIDTSYPIMLKQKTSDTITDRGEKSNCLQRGTKRKIDSITLEEVEEHEHVGKQIQAAESFGVSGSISKGFCPENSISSWPLPKQSRWQGCGQQSYLTSESDSIHQVARLLMVKATFKDDMIKFQFPISSGLLELEKEVAQRLDIKGKRICIKYKDENNNLLRMTCDDDLHTLHEFMASKTAIKIHVELVCD